MIPDGRGRKLPVTSASEDVGIAIGGPMAGSKRPARLVAAGVALSLGASMVPVFAAGSASASSSICNKVTTAEVSSFLGVKATKVSTDVNGYTTVCWIHVGSNSAAAYIRVQTHDSQRGFNADKKVAATQGESPTPDLNFGKLSAFSTSLGSASYGYTYSVTILKKSTELTVGGVTKRLSNVEHLTKKVLTLI